MGIDRQWAEEHGLTLREFQNLILSAQRKLARREDLTDQERAAWDFAMNGTEPQQQFS